MGTTSPDLFLVLDRSRPRRLRAQIEDGLREAIRSGRLQPGTRLPSTRALAADLGVTRGVVVDAYEQLAAEGYVTSVQGSGTVVNDVGAGDLATGSDGGAPPPGPVPAPRPESAAGPAVPSPHPAPSTDPSGPSPARRATSPVGGPAAPGRGTAPASPPAGAGHPGASPSRRPGPAGDQPRLTHDFRTGLPDLSLFPRAAWVRATRAALATMPDAELGYVDAAGLPRLRAAVASYLGRVRGVACRPEHVVICNGFGHGFSLVMRVLVDRGHADVAVEVPGYGDAREQVRWAGGRIHPIPVDGDGIRTDLVAQSPARAVVVTPAHQAPTGVVLAPRRRGELAEWARAADAYVIEDDYDAEYRYDRQPVGALQGVLPDRVIYHGTLSKSLAPGMRLGWLVVPSDLIDDVVAARHITERMTSPLMQATFAEMLERGDLDRHLRRTRRIYRQRRDALVAALHRWLPEARVQGVSAGLQAFVTLPPGWDSAEVAAAARAHGVGVYPVADPELDPDRRSASLVLGYGTLRPDQIHEGIERLAAAAAGIPGRSGGTAGAGAAGGGGAGGPAAVGAGAVGPVAGAVGRDAAAETKPDAGAGDADAGPVADAAWRDAAAAAAASPSPPSGQNAGTGGAAGADPEPPEGP